MKKFRLEKRFLLELKQIAAKSLISLTALIFSYASYGQTTWQSTIVNFGTNGQLQYVADSNQNKVVDFSWAGYKNSNEPIPAITNIIATLTPVTGDNTAAINNAIQAAASVQPGTNGFRGVILLKAGNYEIRGTILLNVSGIVLRGEGSGTLGTVLTATGNTPNQRTVFIAGGGTSAQWKKSGSIQTNITTPFVPVGSRQFIVANASLFAVGDPIVVYHPSSAAWITSVDNGGVAGAAPWSPGTIDIQYNRTIVAIAGNNITIDAPVMNHLDLSLTQSYIYKIDKSTTKNKIGIENLRIDIQNWTTYRDEAHAWEGLVMADIEDSWARNVVVLHFGQSGFQTFTANRITIDSCKALEPCAQLLGSQRDNFQINEWSSNILITKCFSDSARHSFEVSGKSSASGIVFHRCVAAEATNSSEGHFHWSTGLLFDCFRDSGGDSNPGTMLGIYNRGNYGTNHGWASAHSVAWNCDLRRTTGAGGELGCQNPPTAKNYTIGGFGQVNTNLPFPQYGVGYVEGFNNYSANLTPESLFEQQLCNRLLVQPSTITGNASPCAASSQTYSIGAIATATSYTWTLPTGWAGSSTSTTITVTTGSTGGTISVTANNSCGSSTAKTLAVTTTTAPAQPGTISGNATVCSSASQTYSVSAVAGATSYTWSLPSGWAGTSTTNSIAVTAGSTGGNITVKANNICGSSAVRTLALTIGSVSATITPSGNVSICTGTNITFTATTGTGYTYQWYRNNVAKTGATSSTYSTSSHGNYTVKITVPGCGTSTSAITVLTVNSLPSATVSPVGPLTICAGQTATLSVTAVAGQTYQWQRNSTDIAGAIASTYGATTTGYYGVKVTNQYGCSRTSSATVSVTVNCSLQNPNMTNEGKEKMSLTSITISPNPSTGKFNLIVNNLENETATLCVVDMTGRVISSPKLIIKGETISFEEKFSPGIYLLKVFDRDKQFINKIIIE